LIPKPDQPLGRPLRIMQLVSSPTTSGPSVHVIQLSSLLQAAGHEVVIVARPHSWIAGEAARLGLEVILSRLHRFPPGEIWRLAREVRVRRIDLLHTHMSRAHFMGVLLRAWCRVPCVATAHNRKLQPHWYFNDFVISTSRDTEHFHRRYNRVPAERIRTIYCPVPPRPTDSVTATSIFRQINSWRSTWGRGQAHPGRIWLGVVGVVSAAKGQIHLLRAVRHLCDRGHDVGLVVLGNHQEAYIRTMQALCQQSSIEDRVFWAGYSDQIPNLMAALDIYVSPSLNESLPLTILEAMAAARPIVATRVGGVPEIVADGDTGLLVPPRQPEALAKAIERLIESPGLAQRLGQQAWARIQGDFEPGRQAQKIQAVYRRLCFNGTASTEAENPAVTDRQIA